MNSSGYNRKAFSYLVKEYTYLERLLDKKDQKWVAVVYEKMLLHCHYHISSMAFIGDNTFLSNILFPCSSTQLSQYAKTLSPCPSYIIIACTNFPKFPDGISCE